MTLWGFVSVKWLDLLNGVLFGATGPETLNHDCIWCEQVVDLKGLLEARGLGTSGKKAQLVERLLCAAAEARPPPAAERTNKTVKETRQSRPDSGTNKTVTARFWP